MRKGYLDPDKNVWDLPELKDQLEWAAKNNIEVVGYGIINGPMSGHRHVLDFDQGDQLAAVAGRIKTQTGIDIMEWPRVKSGRTSKPGYHIICRSTESLRKQPLANDEHGKVIAELMGEGSQAVGPGSASESGNYYATEHGNPYDPPVIPIDKFRACSTSCARSTPNQHRRRNHHEHPDHLSSTNRERAAENWRTGLTRRMTSATRSKDMGTPVMVTTTPTRTTETARTASIWWETISPITSHRMIR